MGLERNQIAFHKWYGRGNDPFQLARRTVLFPVHKEVEEGEEEEWPASFLFQEEQTLFSSQWAELVGTEVRMVLY